MEVNNLLAELERQKKMTEFYRAQCDRWQEVVDKLSRRGKNPKIDNCPINLDLVAGADHILN